MSTTGLAFAGATFTHVGYVDAPVPPELIGLDADVIAAVPWHARCCSPEGLPVIGVGAWFADIDGARYVFDPLQAADGVLRADRDAERAHQEAVRARFAEADRPVESVDAVVLSHVDGIGMVARRDDDGRWAPFFPNARILLSEQEFASLEGAASSDDDPLEIMVLEALEALNEQGCIETFTDGASIAPGLTARVLAGHGPGHAVFDYTEAAEATEADASGPALSLIGHLALSPLHLATGPCLPQHEDPEGAWDALQRVAGDGRILVGPLWPNPGHGRWIDDVFEPGT